MPRTTRTKARKAKRDPHREAGLVTLSELGREHGHDYRTLRRAVEAGKLKARTFGGTRRYVHPDDYAAFVRGDEPQAADSSSP